MNISVIIPVYNRAAMVKMAVGSALNQTHPPREVIVVDDGSTDNPEPALKDIRDSRLKYISQAHRGVAAARNLGIKEAQADWLAFLDSDDYWLPEKLAAQAEFHRRRPDYLISQTDELWMRNGVRVNPKKYHRKPERYCYELTLERCLISPSAVILHRSLLDDVGLFDEDFPACEDYDLWLRITHRYPVGLIKDKLVVKIGGHDDQLSRKIEALDRFRVTALMKALDKLPLTPAQNRATVNILQKKLAILIQGSAKRGKKAEADKYKELMDQYSQFD